MSRQAKVEKALRSLNGWNIVAAIARKAGLPKKETANALLALRHQGKVRRQEVADPSSCGCYEYTFV